MESKSIAEIFSTWESKNGFEFEYIVDEKTYKEQKAGLFKQFVPETSEPVPYLSNGADVIIISDLHIASGRNEAGVFKGTENFFADEAFDRFVGHLIRLKAGKPGILVINGDMFDFLRVTEYPGKVREISTSRKIRNFLKAIHTTKPVAPAPTEIQNEFQHWSAELEKIGIYKDVTELRNNISKREEEYGLETDDYKSIYKLIQIRKGHTIFFNALAKWLHDGNKLLILKGNHDLEICMKNVRNYIRLMLAETLMEYANQNDLGAVLENFVLPRIKFIDDAVVIDKLVYIEHGHRYDKFTMILDHAMIEPAKQQVNLPFGSFFNRYVINRLELYYPYLDKVRPARNILPMLIRDNFPLALKVIFNQLPFALRILTTRPRYVWFMFNRVFWFFLALFLPLVLVLIFRWHWLIALIFEPKKSAQPVSIFTQWLTNSGKAIGVLVASYLLTRMVGWFQLTEPDSLASCAGKRLGDEQFKVMTMGHTHNPGEYILKNGARFYNTGTWIPVIEISNASVRDNYSYTFLHLKNGLGDELEPANGGLLQRWNDEAERVDPQLLILRK
ncbi:hypothetical protein ACPPVU_13035 [Mucilaginibacter sp. McL0603]|uniref:hypothetical protein n=1 Tax=Mucilaginibacter sp. McL0603 TaxID=3415670 RepID=UPI003CEF2A80